MRTHCYKASGINLKSNNLGNIDRIITVFTREFGKISLVAKGCRKPKSKFGGRLEALCHNNYLATKGKKSLDHLNQVETISNLGRIRDDYNRIEAGLYLLWAVDKSTVEEQQNPAMFDLLLSCLKALANKQKSIERIKEFFLTELLKIEGILDESDYSEKSFEQKFFSYVH